jgi:hypothetical protein
MHRFHSCNKVLAAALYIYSKKGLVLVMQMLETRWDLKIKAYA